MYCTTVCSIKTYMKIFETTQRIINHFKKLSLNGGFTLIELMISVSLYTVIATVLISILLIVSSTNKKLQSNEHAINGLVVSIESMKREIKLGTNFRCDLAGSDLSRATGQFIVDDNSPRSASLVTSDCRLDPDAADVYKGGSTRLTFRTDINTFASYYLGKAPGDITDGIMRVTYNTGGVQVGDPVRLTTDDIDMQLLFFYVEGTDQADARQPIIIIKAKGINKKSGAGANFKNSKFFMESTITPIGLDG